jgi:tripartite-type tricarboxylate transporter receptor subunit TctC
MRKLLLALLMVPVLALAWEPTKPITVLIPTGPGSGNDLSTRAFVKEIEQSGKHSFVVEYRPGADGNIMLKQLLDASPDGYTIGIPSCQSAFVFSESHFMNVIKRSPFDLTLIAGIGKSPMAIVATPKSKVNTFQELIKDLKTPDRNINFAVGGAAHLLTWEYMMDKLGGDRKKIASISYKGPVPAITDVASGQTEFGIVPITVANNLVQAGRVKLLAVAGEQKIDGIPDNIPLAKNFISGLNVYGCWVVALPPNTPPEIAKWYTENVVSAIKSDGYKTYMNNNLIFLDRQSLTNEGIRADLTKLKSHWAPYVSKIDPQ